MLTVPKPSRASVKKPAKPYPDFPLFAHVTGRWAKKIRGRFAFFGPWRDPEGALQRYLAERDELYAGRVPRPQRAAAEAGASPTAAPSLRDLVNDFLTAKQRRLQAGEMGRRGFSDYHATCRRLVQAFGVHRRVDDLSSSDFGVFRSELASTRGPVALGNEINRVRSVFKYGFDAGIIDKPVRFGPEFVRPPKRVFRLTRHAQGVRMFEAQEIHRLLEAAGPALKAMILLGVNAGLGNTDVAELPFTALDLHRGVLDFPRPKTGIARRCVLWKETVQAIRAYLKVRPEPKLAADQGVLFITKYGHRWVRVQEPGGKSLGRTQAVVSDGVGLQFGKLVRETKTYKPGRSFYALRHTFRTVADELGDRRAIDLIMGHESGGDISTHYVERIEDARLERVVDWVSRWLFSPCRPLIGGASRGTARQGARP